MRFTTSSYSGVRKHSRGALFETSEQGGENLKCECRNHPLSSRSFSSKNCCKTWSATVQVPLAVGKEPLQSSEMAAVWVSSTSAAIPHPPDAAQPHHKHGFCSSEQPFLPSFGLFIYIYSRRGWEIWQQSIPSPALLMRRNYRKVCFLLGWLRTACSDPAAASLKMVNHHFHSCCPVCSSSSREKVSESHEVRGNPTQAEGKPHLGASTESGFYLFILCAWGKFHVGPPESSGYIHYWRKMLFQSSQSTPSFLCKR